MDILSLQLRRVKKAHSKLDGEVSKLETLIQGKSDFEIFLQWHPSDGYLVMSDIGGSILNFPVGMPLKTVIDVIQKEERLTLENWEPIG